MEKAEKMFDVKKLAICSLCCALTCVLAMVAIPIGVVPITFATIGVYISGGLAGTFYGAISQILYLFLVFLGLPFTARFHGGPAVLFGPTGGYMFAYVLMASLTGFFYKRFTKNSKSYAKKMFWFFVGAVIGTIFCYFSGTVWFCNHSKMSFLKSLSVCVYPFIIGDLLKIIATMIVVPRIESILLNRNS